MCLLLGQSSVTQRLRGPGRREAKDPDVGRGWAERGPTRGRAQRGPRPRPRSRTVRVNPRRHAPSLSLAGLWAGGLARSCFLHPTSALGPSANAPVWPRRKPRRPAWSPIPVPFLPEPASWPRVCPGRQRGRPASQSVEGGTGHPRGTPGAGCWAGGPPGRREKRAGNGSVLLIWAQAGALDRASSNSGVMSRRRNLQLRAPGPIWTPQSRLDPSLSALVPLGASSGLALRPAAGAGALARLQKATKAMQPSLSFLPSEAVSHGFVFLATHRNLLHEKDLEGTLAPLT